MSGEKSKVVAGLIIGMVLGLAIAGGVAWYVVNKNPAEFVAKDKAKPAPTVSLLPASAPAAVPAPTVGEAEPKQQFEFYKVLTDKSDSTARKPTTKPKSATAVKPPAVAATKEMYFVQAGSFQNEGDAEKLKAKLAFSGFEASIQTATIPDKGIWHRVRLGPYDGTEAGKTITALRQNGIIATQVRAQ
ncbi:MAG: SPOR domain-containing protein [Gammaproteobacteria bacterium]|nr:SPOR domain-containing protein [Gammaproteobacteria bacterium]MBU1775292.1 SPOR domain-containing protein [Gammaproteobacteria bacterium]MBU1968056.1 SPOR domain-containing protein [Gammaproteobacteria bacterium]